MAWGASGQARSCSRDATPPSSLGGLWQQLVVASPACLLPVVARARILTRYTNGLPFLSCLSRSRTLLILSAPVTPSSPGLAGLAPPALLALGSSSPPATVPCSRSGSRARARSGSHLAPTCARATMHPRNTPAGASAALCSGQSSALGPARRAPSAGSPSFINLQAVLARCFASPSRALRRDPCPPWWSPTALLLPLGPGPDGCA